MSNNNIPPLAIKSLYNLPGDEWKIVCDAMANAAWFALHDERANPRNEAQIFGLAAKYTEERYRRHLQQGSVLTNDCCLYMHYFSPNFRDCYQSTLALSDEEHEATKTMMDRTFGNTSKVTEQYQRIYGDRARQIITKEHNRFMQL